MENESQEQPAVTILRLFTAAIVVGLLVSLIALPGVGGVGVAARGTADSFEKISDDEALSLTPPERSRIMTADGDELAQFYKYNREPVSLEKIAPIMQKAVIAIEDSRFYEHGPLDPKGTMRALLNNAGSGETQGGSTLTQQYVKNLLVLNAKTEKERAEAKALTIGRKVRELRYAVNIEKRKSKNEIFEGYLNVAYFGSGAYGVQAAAQRYFHKDASSLKLAEAALLAGITKDPFNLDPERKESQQASLERRNLVIDRMAELKMVSKQEADEAKASPVKLNPKPATADCVESKAPYFCRYVKEEILSSPEFGKTKAEREWKLYRGGLTITSTIELQAQRAADSAVRRRADPKSKWEAFESMVEPGTGHIKALAVNKKYGVRRAKQETTINLAADAKHGGGGLGFEAGSTFKIFTLAAAIEEGIDVGRAFKSPNGITVNGYRDCNKRPQDDWPVSNAEPGEKGSYNLRTGTQHSVNTFFALLEKEVGLCQSVRMAERFGMRQANGEALLQYPSQVLGTNGVDMTSLAAAYAGFANRGKFCTPIAITKATDAQGKQVKVPEGKCKQVLKEDIADKINEILRGVFTQGTAKRYGGLSGRESAGKTGTCNQHHCVVFAGYTPDLASAMWYGNMDAPNRDTLNGVFGADLVPYWRDSMQGALEGKPARQFHKPGNNYGDIKTLRVPYVTGLDPGAARSKLEAAGFNVVTGGRVKSRQRKGTVAYTSPGGSAEQGSTITIYISRGRKGRPRRTPEIPGWPWTPIRP